MQQERAKSSKEGQSENQSGKLPGEQRCQVWNGAGPAGPLQQEDSSGGEVTSGRKRKDVGRWD